jgi:hypothetical protein
MNANPISFNADSDEDYDWEEVEVADIQPQALEITLNVQPKAKEAKKFDRLSCCFCY